MARPPDGSRFELRRIDADLAQRYVQEGFWDDQALGAVLSEGLHDAAAEAFTVRSDRNPYRGTLGEVDALGAPGRDRAAARGVKAGDAVAFQLPNWVEAAATFYAIAYLGAIVVPIVHFYGPKEVAYILQRTRVKALVTADHFGHLDFVANLDAMRAELPDLEWAAVVGDPGPSPNLPFADLVADDPIAAPAAVDPDRPALIAYTSGTTSDPKGVMHSHRTIGAEIRQLGAIQPAGPAALVGAPVGHGIGMLAALLLPVYRRQPVHLIDVWDPGRVLAAMLEDGLVVRARRHVLPHQPARPSRLRRGEARQVDARDRARRIGGARRGRRARRSSSASRRCAASDRPSTRRSPAAAPRRRARSASSPTARRCRAWRSASSTKTATTCRPAIAGEIWSRGPECFVGYTDPALTAQAFAPGGWFMTGDVGVLDDDGYLAITDRKKDIIIRGGENVSAVEVEEQLLRLPGVSEVAVVAAPDPKLGERGCAFLRMQPGINAPDLDRGARAPRSTRPRAAEVARGRARDRRVPAHAERQDPEVRAAPTAAGRSADRRERATTPEQAPRAALGRARRSTSAASSPGPLATFFLASMGAEVIAIEPPTPSTSRRMPPLAGPEGGARTDYVDGALSVPFLKRARGKRSVALDIQRPEGQELVRRLVARADVFVENSRPGTMHEFGLGHEELRRADPRLITCAISGYGQRDQERPAMDVIVQAVSGAMAKTGFADGPPLRSGITIADHTTATFAALGIVAALRQRDLTGVGQLVDVAMLDVLTALVFDEPVDHYAATGIPVRTGNADARGAPINSYRCADGWVAVTCTSEGQFARLCALMGRPELLEQFPDVRARARGARELDHAIEAWTATRPAREVEAALVGIGFPAGRVRDPIEAARDPRSRSARCWRSSATRTRPPTARAASSAPGSRSRSTAGSTCRRPSRSARAPMPCCAMSRGCDDDRARAASLREAQPRRVRCIRVIEAGGRAA